MDWLPSRSRPLGVLALVALALPGLATGATLKGIQHGTGQIAAGANSTTATLTSAVDPTKAFLVFSYTIDATDPRNVHVSGQITSVNQVTFTRSGTLGTVEISWDVVEFSSGVKVQRGSASLTSESSTVTIDAPISGWGRFPLISQHLAGVNLNQTDFLTARFPTATQLELAFFEHALADEPLVVEWQVVEMDNATVEARTASIAPTGTQVFDTLPTPVDPAKTWLVYTYRSQAVGGTSEPHKWLLEGQITGGGASVTFQRNSSELGLDVVYYLVKFTDSTTVQHGTTAFTALDPGTKNVGITSVSRTRSFAVGGYQQRGGRTSYVNGTTDNPGSGWLKLEQTADNNLAITRALTGYTTSIGWFVVTFVDTTSPTVSALTVTPSPNKTGDHTVSWTASDTGASGLASIKVYRQGNGTGPFNLVATLAGSATSWQQSPAVSQGSYVYRVVAEDGATNTGQTDSATVIVDTTPPNVTSLTVSPSPNKTGDHTVSWIASDSGGSALASIKVYRQDTSTGPFNLVATLDETATSWQQSPAIGPGTYVYRVVAEDRATNTGQADSAAVAVEPAAPPGSPVITRDALSTGGVGVPYPYNAQGRVGAVGSRPLLFAGCGGPAGFRVEPLTGQVSWTPTQAGTFTLCVSAQNAVGSDSYSFPVVVSPPSGQSPVASLTVTPSSGPAPLTVLLDGSGSTADPSTSLVAYRWSFGDGAPLGFGAQTSHTYTAPGGYQAQLTVLDGFGRQASAKQAVRVTNHQGQLPPSSQIVASTLSGSNSLTVQFSCDCREGSAPISTLEWDFSTGRSTDASPQYTFSPGRYQVHLTVVDGNGLTAHDTVEVSVSQGGAQPPHCGVFAEPPSGPAPLTVLYSASFGDADGQVESHSFTFEDGSTFSGLEISRQHASPGRYFAKLDVIDSQGLGCHDRVDVLALGKDGRVPPRIVSSPETAARCGVPYSYSPRIAGDGPAHWSLDPADEAPVPDGIDLDPGTGRLSWVPSSEQAGRQQMLLRVSTSEGEDVQRIEIEVSCAELAIYQVGCGCRSSGGDGLAVLALAAALRAMVSRRAPPPR